MNRRVRVWPAAFGMLMLFPVRAPAQIFECLDADGRREFAQKCAAGTVKQREVSKAGAANPDTTVVPAQPAYKEEEFAFQQRRLQREASENREKAVTSANAGKCQNARSRLVSIENARRVRSGTDPQTGQARYLDDTERAAATQKARDEVSAYCK